MAWWRRSSRSTSCSTWIWPRSRTPTRRSTSPQQQRSERLAAIGQVAGGIAHELRNPLNVVKTSVYYLLNAKNPTAAKQAEHLTRIERHVTLADGVITALSSFARMPVPNLQPFPVAQCVQEALETNPVPENVQVTLDCPPSLPPVLGDIDQLRIVFANLIRNAREAMPQGGPFDPRADGERCAWKSRSPIRVWVSLPMTSIGSWSRCIPPRHGAWGSDLPSREPSWIKTKEACGSPARSARAVRSRFGSPPYCRRMPTNHDREKRPSILVVDDEVDTCRNLSDILTDLGYQVDIAHEGLTALEMVRQERLTTWLCLI